MYHQQAAKGKQILDHYFVRKDVFWIRISTFHWSLCTFFFSNSNTSLQLFCCCCCCCLKVWKNRERWNNRKFAIYLIWSSYDRQKTFQVGHCPSWAPPMKEPDLTYTILLRWFLKIHYLYESLQKFINIIYFNFLVLTLLFSTLWHILSTRWHFSKAHNTVSLYLFILMQRNSWFK